MATIPDTSNFALTDRDREVLTQSDDGFKLHSWEELQKIISENELQVLTRSPSQTRQYLSWREKIKEQYGTITAYLLSQRLQWTPLDSEDPNAAPTFAYKNPMPFADPIDYKVMLNDWPYGLDPGIVHICVWSKTPIPVDPDRGDVTERSRLLIEEFVNKTFREKLKEEWPGDRVLWFKNWTALQSVRGVDHVHVLVKDAPEEVVGEWVKQPSWEGMKK